MTRLWFASATLVFVAVTLLKAEMLNNRESGRWNNSVMFQSISHLCPFQDIDNRVNAPVISVMVIKMPCRHLERIFPNSVQSCLKIIWVTFELKVKALVIMQNKYHGHFMKCNSKPICLKNTRSWCEWTITLHSPCDSKGWELECIFAIKLTKLDHRFCPIKLRTGCFNGR